jgi:hypothetical protein
MCGLMAMSLESKMHIQAYPVFYCVQREIYGQVFKRYRQCDGILAYVEKATSTVFAAFM